MLFVSSCLYFSLFYAVIWACISETRNKQTYNFFVIKITSFKVTKLLIGMALESNEHTHKTENS